MKLLAIIIVVSMILPGSYIEAAVGQVTGQIEGAALYSVAAEAPTMESVTAGVNEDLRRIRELHDLPGMQLTSDETAYISSRQRDVPKVEEFTDSWQKEVRVAMAQPSAPDPMTPKEINNFKGDMLEIDGAIFNMDEYFVWRYNQRKSGSIHFWRGEIVDDTGLRFYQFLILVATIFGIIYIARDN